MSSFSVDDLLQSSGPIALNELVMRLSEGPQETVKALKRLQIKGNVSISGPLAGKIRSLITDPEPNAKAGGVETLTDDEIMQASDTVIAPSTASLHRMFSRG
jgi:hypothetical protein